MDRNNCPAGHHGTVSAYRFGCRCADAREERRLYLKRWRLKRNPPARICSIGTARKLQALAALGWRVADVANLMGVSHRNVRQLRACRNRTVLRATAARVDRVYRQLQGTRGPSSQAATWAANQGWVVPLLWEDDTIDDPSAHPIRAAVSRRDTVAEIRWLASFGTSAELIATQMGIKVGSVHRALERERSAA